MTKSRFICLSSILLSFIGVTVGCGKKEPTVMGWTGLNISGPAELVVKGQCRLDSGQIVKVERNGPGTVKMRGGIPALCQFKVKPALGVIRYEAVFRDYGPKSVPIKETLLSE